MHFLRFWSQLWMQYDQVCQVSVTVTSSRWWTVIWHYILKEVLCSLRCFLSFYFTSITLIATKTEAMRIWGTRMGITGMTFLKDDFPGYVNWGEAIQPTDPWYLWDVYWNSNFCAVICMPATRCYNRQKSTVWGNFQRQINDTCLALFGWNFQWNIKEERVTLK